MRNATDMRGEERPVSDLSWRRLAVGAELRAGGGVHFRVWAPSRRRVSVAVDPGADPGVCGETVSLENEDNGYFSGFAPDFRSGDRYAFWLDDETRWFPDPASRFQPQGPHGPSQVVDPDAYVWNDAEWGGVGAEGNVIYEMHVGTFTPEGTYAAAMAELPALRELGVTVIELMPLADFCGEFGWGYDGVNLYAPTRLYGAPDALRRFIDAAHGAGLGVILDVVYNHFGPSGNYLMQYSSDYMSSRHKSEWGETPNFDGPNSIPVRDYISANSAYWIDEFHFDGLRLDATQQVFDDSAQHVLALVTQRAERAARGRKVYIVSENEPQDTRLIGDRADGGFGGTAMWNDDYHHTATVAMTGRCEAYYSDYRGTAQELVSVTTRGFLFQGQYYTWQRQPRGTSTRGIPLHRFVAYLDNHDQVANTGSGARCHQVTAPGRYRALTAWLLLGPQTPMLFQGQEFAASTPFLYFADQPPELAGPVEAGRREFLAQFPSLASPEMQRALASPCDRETFMRSKLDLGERERHAWAYALHRDLLQIRRDDAAIRRGNVEGAVLSADAFVLRYFDDEGDDRLLLVNLGGSLRLAPMPEPLLAPPLSYRWKLEWSSESPVYGGAGTPAFDDRGNFQLPGHSALLLRLDVETSRHDD